MDALEREIQAEIVQELKALRFDVVVLSQAKRTRVTPGTPDLYVRHAGHQVRAWLETKRPKEGRLDAKQLEWIAKERAAGGLVEVVRSRADVTDFARRCGVLGMNPVERARAAMTRPHYDPASGRLKR